MSHGLATTLLLRHSDISTTTTTQTIDNPVGGWSNYKQTAYWYIYLKVLLGVDFNKYDKFCIRLNQLSIASVAYPTSTTLDVSWISYMGGLNWSNSSFSQASGNNGSLAPLCLC